MPKATNEFKSNCENIKNDYPKETCQKALQKLIMGENEQKLKKMFGDKIMGCFAQDDTDRWLNK